MVIYALKEKFKIKDALSTLPKLDDMAFLRDLGLIPDDNGELKLYQILQALIIQMSP